MPDRLRKNFRIGVLRGDEFRPVASVGLSRDGGIMIAPYAVRDYNWRYGTSHDTRSGRTSEFLEIPERPKLHYHRSGIASVTLDGTEIERRRLALPPVASVSRGQVLSVVAIRPWEMLLAPQRVGDIFSAGPRWPDAVVWTFQLLRYAGALPIPPEALGRFAPMALLPGDERRWFIDMSWYMPNTVLIGASSSVYEDRGFLEPSITVAAIPWSADRSGTERHGAFTLWSSSLNNPQVAHAPDDDILTEAQFAERLSSGEMLFETSEQYNARLFST